VKNCEGRLRKGKNNRGGGMSYRIGPHDTIPLGSYVQVGNKLGYVIKAEVVPASNGGEIVLHTISFTEKKRYLYGSKYKIEPLTKPKIEKINYSFIVVLH
jgi:hypothetical protein